MGKVLDWMLKHPGASLWLLITFSAGAGVFIATVQNGAP